MIAVARAALARTVVLKTAVVRVAVTATAKPNLWLALGSGGARLRLSDMGVTGVQDMVVVIVCQWPLG